MTLLLWAALQGGDPALDALRYLARHQSAGGPWGPRAAACRCPGEPVPPAVPPADQALRDRLLVLLDTLEVQDPERRNDAQRELATLGWPAEPLLSEAAKSGSAERRGRLQDVLCDIRRSAAVEDVEATAWSLLAFLGAGFSPLSKDVHDGRCFGDAVQRGLASLIAKQDARGAVAAPASAPHAVAALALSEAYGMTNRDTYREPAQKAIELLAAHLATEGRPLAWQAMAVKSAELSGLSVPREAAPQLLKRLAARRAAEPEAPFARAAHVMAHIFFLKTKEGLDVAGLADVDPAAVERDAAYLSSLAAFQFDGPKGPLSTRCAEAERRRFYPLQASGAERCDAGSWPADGTRARLVSAAHGAMIATVR